MVQEELGCLLYTWCKHHQEQVTDDTIILSDDPGNPRIHCRGQAPHILHDTPRVLETVGLDD
ncbi:uncharacterized protein PHALS_05829 [Plasmopara halstedii]|uniref:Uncharacterized protein n=1 Tax=Plasmopara halstedii TaxID=4781 RepID=A0A0P1B295_PLAHL|nr:uncharacterized protein PHALS_05829 [Plasmopara halstedii]CEG48256.1 hypothetical protein PHALS_05829 [Plasmopara halstedii]|eukprot:XP_024584625.1 hypothetical protein PHALS_05829 [Plasmopara halstedii]